MDLKTNPREPLETLKTYPAFQNLRAKAETHQLQFRPKESQELQAQGTLEEALDERTQSAWNILADCRRNGMHLNEAEEIALPSILVRSEKQDEQDQLDQQEQTDNP
jgi:hypothetical protein